jgi:spermidine synthase
MNRSSRTRAQRALAMAMMVASGFAGLGYQIVWTQQSALWLGHEAAAVLAVVAAFFGGLALGAWAIGGVLQRSRRPARWYAACEALIGLWSLALAHALLPASNFLLDLIGVQPSPPWHWSVAFVGTFLLLLPATAAMGATLPAMERVLASVDARRGRIAVLYASNTFGAVLGVLGAAFCLVPWLGLLGTAGVCAFLNLLCAVLALRLPSAPALPPGSAVAATNETIAAPGALRLLALTGMLGIGYEVLVVRVLSQVAENTVYTFALLLAVYLVGTTVGATWISRHTESTVDSRLRDRLLRALTACCLLGTFSLAYAGVIKAAVLENFGPGMAAALGAETALAIVAFLLPTLVMGALFSLLCAQAAGAGVSLGRALGINTLGAAIAPLLFGVLLLPAVGSRRALLAVAAGYLLVQSRHAWRIPSQWVATAALAALTLWGPSLVLVDVPEGGRLLRYSEGVMAAVSIVEDADGVARLHINNRQQEGSSATVFADARQALLPILLHPAPRQALFIGLGTGVTAASAAQDPQLQVDAVELLPEVIEASADFRARLWGKSSNPRLHLLAADARRFVRTSPSRYDLVVADNFHPARSGSGALYTVEHFRAVNERLNEGGLFCQWLPLHQLDLYTLRSIVRSFVAVYPHAWAMLATNSLETPVLGLVAQRGDAGFSPTLLRERLARIELPRSPAEFGLDDEFAVLGSFVAGPSALARFAGVAPLNSDDRPVVAYGAPRITYAPDSSPRERLIELVAALELQPDELLAPPTDAAFSARLAAYWAARNHYLLAGRDVKPSADVRRMLTQVREPLLDVLRMSPDFRPAYDPLLHMAVAMGRTDPAAARDLLQELQHLQPARPEAARILSELAH